MQNKNEKSTDSRNLFNENVWLLLDNAELILNTPALFYASTHDGDLPDDMKYSKLPPQNSSPPTNPSHPQLTKGR